MEASREELEARVVTGEEEEVLGAHAEGRADSAA